MSKKYINKYIILKKKREGRAVAPPPISNYASAGVERMRIGPRWRALQRVRESDLKIAGARVNFPAGGKNMKGGSEGREARCV